MLAGHNVASWPSSEKNTWINERRSHYTMTLLVKGARSPVSESLVIKLIFLQILHIGSLLFLEQLSPTSVSRHFRKKFLRLTTPCCPVFFHRACYRKRHRPPLLTTCIILLRTGIFLFVIMCDIIVVINDVHLILIFS